MTPLEAALSAIDQFVGPTGDPLVAAKCRGLMRGYDARWGAPQFTVLEVEELVESDLYNPATSARSRTFRIAGKKDLVVDRGGRRVLFDHKTTGDDIKDPNAPYWRQLVIEAQPSHYMLLEWLNGRKIDESVWDVLRKPDIRPKQIAKKDREEVSRFQHYFGYLVSAQSIAEMTSTERETFEMYEIRLAHDCIKERPEHYFQRRSVPRLDAEIHEHASELWDYAQEVIMARRLDRHPRNSGACMNYGRPCVFLGICAGHDSPDSSNWARREQVHRELDLVGTDGRDVLTNSRLTVFKTCRRKHYLQYELGIERLQEDEAESLYFGNAWHSALEAYFNAAKGTNNVNSNGVPATEVGNVRTAEPAEV